LFGDQCPSSSLCGFFCPKREGDEIELTIERGRREFYEDWFRELLDNDRIDF
jgi:hypothetical protein